MEAIIVGLLVFVTMWVTLFGWYLSSKISDLQQDANRALDWVKNELHAQRGSILGVRSAIEARAERLAELKSSIAENKRTKNLPTTSTKTTVVPTKKGRTNG